MDKNIMEDTAPVVLVTDDVAFWSFLNEFPVIHADHYLQGSPYQTKHLHVLNLCQSYTYQSLGYYVSLLALAQEQKVMPSIHTMQDVTICLSEYFLQEMKEEIQKNLQTLRKVTYKLRVYFGECMQPLFSALAKKIYEKLPVPLLEIQFRKQNGLWLIEDISPLKVKNIPKEEHEFMQIKVRHHLNRKSFSEGGRKKRSFFHLAILIDPDEPEDLASSDQTALKKFAEAGQSLGIQVDFIGKNDIKRLPEYAGLFIRNSTDVFLYTYQFARYAERENLVVIDDTQSILRCGNKVYQAMAFQSHNIKAPQTIIVNKYQQDNIKVTFPCVVKAPGEGFCLGVKKANNKKELQEILKDFFTESELLIIQSFLPTEFDWRIGIIDRKPLYAARYYMADNHWQIVNWEAESDGKAEPIPLDKVPEGVIQTALRAANLIGNSLYGVDLKTRDNEHYVIEINDNPSLRCGIEDEIIGDELYRRIMAVFLHRMQAKHGMPAAPILF